MKLNGIFIGRTARLTVAAVFIFSSAVKLVDPTGTAIKLSEYFSTEVLNLPWLMPYVRIWAMLLILLEFYVGWALLIRFRPRLTCRMAFVLVVFFLFLTAYTLVTGKVTDCGCFGDAVKLTPAQTFLKNIGLLALLVPVCREARVPSRTFIKAKGVFLFIAVLVAAAFGIWTFHHLPVVDFRPYKIGVNIPRAMQIPPGAPRDVYHDVWYYEVNGQVRAYETEDKPWDIPGARFIRRESRLVRKGYEPPVQNFFIENDSSDVTDSILHLPDVYLVLFPWPGHLKTADTTALTKLKDFLIHSHRRAAYIIPQPTPLLDQWAHQHGVQWYYMDPVTLKTIIRTPAGVVHLQQGTIKDKQTLHDFIGRIQKKPLP